MSFRGTPPRAWLSPRNQARAAASSDPTMASRERNSRTNSAASCQGLEPGSSAFRPLAMRDKVAPLTPMTCARSACATARKRAARTVARDRVMRGSGAGRALTDWMLVIFLWKYYQQSVSIATCRQPAARRGAHRPGSVKIPRLRAHDPVLAVLLGSLQGRPAGLQQSLERQCARRHEARDPGAHGDVAPGARGGVMHEQVAHALRHHGRVVSGPVRGLALGQHGECSALPAADEIPAPLVRGADHARDAPDAGIARRAVELLVVGAEIIDVEQGEADLVRVARREHPVTLQQLLEECA